MELFYETDRFLNDGQVLESQKIDLQQAQVFDRMHFKLCDDRIFFLWGELYGHTLGERLLCDHGTAGVNGRMACYALKMPRGINKFFRLGICVVENFKFLHALQAFVEPSLFHTLRWIEGDKLRDLITESIGISHCASCIADRGTCRHGSERDDPRHTILTIFLARVRTHLITTSIGKININVRHLNTFRVREPFE